MRVGFVKSITQDLESTETKTEVSRITLLLKSDSGDLSKSLMDAGFGLEISLGMGMEESLSDQKS